MDGFFVPKGVTHIVGIDEAGRGPLAGPVAVGSVVVPVRLLHGIIVSMFADVKESKQLSSAQREIWLKKLLTEKKNGMLDYRCAFSSERIIDREGIVFAIRKAITRTLSGLSVDPNSTLILLDGGLKAPAYFPFQKTIIRGDETEMLIALASIVAKVTRDRKMVRLAKRYPEYGFDRHKGYGTRLHFERIAQNDLCPLHRTSFLKNFMNERHQ